MRANTICRCLHCYLSLFLSPFITHTHTHTHKERERVIKNLHAQKQTHKAQCLQYILSKLYSSSTTFGTISLSLSLFPLKSEMWTLQIRKTARQQEYEKSVSKALIKKRLTNQFIRLFTFDLDSFDLLIVRFKGSFINDVRKF